MNIRLVYFNYRWNIYITTADGYNSWIKTESKQTFRDDVNQQTYRLSTYKHPEIPIFTFGIFMDDPKKRPGHGGEWSSNAQHINTIFNVTLTEVAVDRMSVSVPISWIRQVLGDKVTWAVTNYGIEITDVVGVENKYDNVIEFTV